jgi:hypothetical protein
MSTIKIQTLLLLAFFLSLPFALLSQENDSTQSKVKIKIVKDDDGKVTVMDTTFSVKGDDDVKQIVKEYTIKAGGDTSGTTTYDVRVDVDKDVEWTDDDGNKVIIRKSPGKKVYRFRSGDEGDDEEVIVVSPSGKQKVIKWIDEDGKEHSYDYDFNFDFDHDFDYFDADQFRDEMAKHKDQLKKMRIEILDQKSQFKDQLAEMKALKELENLEGFEDMDFYVLPPKPPASPEDLYFYHNKTDRGVSDIELRDAGIKNKPNRLDLEDINIDNDNGVFDLSFKMKEEGSPRVTVYNVYGDKVFNDKPEMMNNEYQVKMDLSQKQHGTYYLMISSGNSSKTLKIHN